ncbi:F-box protein SKIP24 [Carica papaya]|uniref:F-box protein SKIP24 n=1 Tax=Carica papaya TaxID=3649 RepID=UPI000B8CA981|nr:F-box protein SKIP24 [Carica papaya]
MLPCSSSSPRSLYRVLFEKDRKKKEAAEKRSVMRKESQVFEHLRRIGEIELQLEAETKRMKAAAAEYSNLRKARQASVALNVWQPEIIRSRQKQVVEQNVVPADARLHTLKMELKLCKQQIASFTEAYRDSKEKLEMAKKELQSMKYHPLRDHNQTSISDSECKIKKKFKSTVKFPVKKGSENYDTDDLHWLPY